MDLKLILGLIFLVKIVSSEYNASHLINTTQHLQDLERDDSWRYDKIYPQLNMSDHHLEDKSNNQSIAIPSLKISKTDLEKFINKTLSSMSSGICVKEVPTASLVSDTQVRGNGSDPSLSRIQICCDGYQRNKHIYRKCEPVCINECRNGICTAPDTCTCFPNYVRNEFGHCIPTCPAGCPNGMCNPDNTCNCNFGYILEPNQKVCSPKCDKKCMNSKCTGPNQCTCEKGYVKDAIDFFLCVPTCNPPCINGRCTSPNRCLCNAGYVKDQGVKNTNKCIKS